MRYDTFPDEQGFSLLFLILLLVLLVPFVFVTPFFFADQLSREQLTTQDQLRLLKQAITGNPRLVIEQKRSDFGYSGNMGGPPPSLQDLWIKGSQPGFVFNTSLKIGAGWLGPYFPVRISEFVPDLAKDSYGNPLEYINTEFTRSSDGQLVSVRIRSFGPDRTSGGGDDLIVDILRSEIFANVTGRVVSQGGKGMKGATVTLNLPVNGALGTKTTVTDTEGFYQFTGVSFGLRSITIDPKLSLALGSEKVKGNNRVTFKVTNFATNDTSITSIRADYATTPTSFYEKIRIGNTTVFDFNNNLVGGIPTRKGSGETVTFSPITVGGSGKPSQTVVLRIDSEEVNAPDLTVKGTGDSITIEYQNFKDAAQGSAGNVNPSGTEFTVTFSDGSVVVFTPF